MAKKSFLLAKTVIVANALNIIGIALLLILAFVFQFVFKELPCPLCILQRAGFLLTACGFLFNLHYGLRPSHYVLALLGCLLTSFIALRQIALHIAPGSGTYGSAIFGLHLYSWSFIIAMLLAVLTSAVLALDRQYLEPYKQTPVFKKTRYLLFIVLIVLAITNFVSVLAECGLRECPSDPVSYLW